MVLRMVVEVKVYDAQTMPSRDKLNRDEVGKT